MTTQAPAHPPVLDHWIGGRSVTPTGGDHVPRESPAHGGTVALVGRGSAADVDRAVASAKAAASRWRYVDPFERGRLLAALAGSLREHAD
jgi:acyl-CoA reductase-like NAD-dependent aldehyde dehydrogenase